MTTPATIREGLSRTKRLLAYFPELAEIGGGVTAGIFLSQCLYWMERIGDRAWFFKNREDWRTETGLTRSEQETARRNLRDRGLLKEIWGGNPRRLFFSVDVEKVAVALAGRLDQVANFPLANNSPAGNQPAEIWPASGRKGSPQVGGKPASLMAGNQPAKTPKTTTNNQETSAETSLIVRSKCNDARPENERSDVGLPGQRLAALLRAKILDNKPDYRISEEQLRDWATVGDRMIRVDKRTEERVATVIRWAHTDSFWMSTALSMVSIRKNFDQLELKARGQAPPIRQDIEAEPPKTKSEPARVFDWQIPPGFDRREGDIRWKTALGRMSERINPHSFNTWLTPTRGLGTREGVLLVGIPTAEFSQIGEKYSDLLRELLPEYSVQFVPRTQVSVPQEGQSQ